MGKKKVLVETYDLDQLDTIGTTISSARQSKATKSTYQNKNDHLLSFLKHYYAHTVGEDGQVIMASLNSTILRQVLVVNSYEDPTNAKTIRSVANVEGYYSAMKDLYRHNPDPFYRRMPEEIIRVLDDYIDGFEKTVAQARVDGQTKSTIGKKPLSVEAYKTVSAVSLKENGADSLFVHSYNLLLWNLMQRTSTIGEIHCQNIGWDGDSLMINILKHKGDLTGSSAFVMQENDKAHGWIASDQP